MAELTRDTNGTLQIARMFQRYLDIYFLADPSRFVQKEALVFDMLDNVNCKAKIERFVCMRYLIPVK